MLRTRTFTIAAVVALVALAASVGIAVLQARAGQQRERYQGFIELESSANRLDALESDVNAERRVPLPVQAELTELMRRMSDDLRALSADGAPGAARLRDRFQGYVPLLTEEFALMRARDFAAAAELDAAVDLDGLRAGLRTAAERTDRVAARAERMSWLGTFGVLPARSSD